MRDFNFNDGVNTNSADVSGIRPLETPPEILTLDETPREDSLRPFHVEQSEEESNSLPKIVGAAVIGLLIVGGGLYAYESSFAHPASVKTVAMATTAGPTNMAATAPQPVPDASTAQPAATPAAPVKSATATPAPRTDKTEPVERSASNVSGAGIAPTNDAAINAPMTLTPDTAPPAEQSGSSGQTAEASQPAQTGLQQPITTPSVGNTSQPTASVAANETPSMTPDETSSAPASAEQVKPQPAQVQPAEVQPAQIEPSQLAPQ